MKRYSNERTINNLIDSKVEQLLPLKKKVNKSEDLINRHYLPVFFYLSFLTCNGPKDPKFGRITLKLNWSFILYIHIKVSIK